MNTYQLIEDKISYNQWANQRLVNWLKSEASHLFVKTVQSSFNSLNKVFHHIMEAETYYLSIIQNKPGKYFEELPTAQVFKKLLTLDEQLLAWYLNQETNIVEQVITLKRSPHEESYTVATLICHIVNHGTYHRGQVVAMRHQLGIKEPPKTDYYWMFAEQVLAKVQPNDKTE